MNLKTFLILPVICLLAAGCAKQDDQYAIERAYYHAQKQAWEVMSNPDTTPPMKLKGAVDGLAVFMTKYPGTTVALNAQFTIARVYAAVKQYDKAVAEFNKILDTYKASEEICAHATFMLGGVYEAAGNWEAALKQYNILRGTYTKTVRGIEAPFHIAMRYKAKHQPDKMMEALRDAVGYYKVLAYDTPGSPFALQARLMIAQCYAELKQWENAARAMETVVEDFSKKVATDRILMDIAKIYHIYLKDDAKAKAALEKLVKDHPRSGYLAQARAILNKIEKGEK